MPEEVGGGGGGGVIPTRSDIGCMPSIWVLVKVTQPGQASITLHAQALEGQGRYNAGGTNTTNTVT